MEAFDPQKVCCVRPQSPPFPPTDRSLCPGEESTYFLSSSKAISFLTSWYSSAIWQCCLNTCMDSTESWHGGRGCTNEEKRNQSTGSESSTVNEHRTESGGFCLRDHRDVRRSCWHWLSCHWSPETYYALAPCPTDVWLFLELVNCFRKDQGKYSSRLFQSLPPFFSYAYDPEAKPTWRSPAGKEDQNPKPCSGHRRQNTEQIWVSSFLPSMRKTGSRGKLFLHITWKKFLPPEIIFN